MVLRFKPLMLLAFFLILALAACQGGSSEATDDFAASLPPGPNTPPPAKIDGNKEDAAETTPVVKPTASMPTAISRMIAVVFSTPTAVPTATAEPSSTPSPTPPPTPCSEPGQIVTGTYPSEAAGTSAYRIYLPPCYEPEGPSYPTLYMLPGNIYTDDVWDRLGLDETAEAAIMRGDIPPMMIVMADSGYLLDNSSGGDWSYETQITNDLIPFIESNYCAWSAPQGRAIGGMSRGGYWSLEIAFRHPEMFASVGGHSAALLDLYGGPDVIPQETGLANDLGPLRIYFDIGENDWVITNIQQLHEDMQSAGIQHVWMLNAGRHEESYWASHTGDYLAWYAEPWSFQRDAYPLCSLAQGESSTN